MRRVIILIFAMTAIATAQQPAPEIESIRQADMRADLTFLASDAMAGRLTDTPQNGAGGGVDRVAFRAAGAEAGG